MIGFANESRVMCPACLGPDGIGLLVRHGTPKPLPVATLDSGIPLIDGSEGPWVVLLPDDLDAWQPWGATCERCKKELHAPRHGFGRVVDWWIGTTAHHRLTSLAAWATEVMPELMPSREGARIQELNRPANCRAPEVP